MPGICEAKRGHHPLVPSAALENGIDQEWRPSDLANRNNLRLTISANPLVTSSHLDFMASVVWSMVLGPSIGPPLKTLKNLRDCSIKYMIYSGAIWEWPTKRRGNVTEYRAYFAFTLSLSLSWGKTVPWSITRSFDKFMSTGNYCLLTTTAPKTSTTSRGLQWNKRPCMPQHIRPRHLPSFLPFQNKSRHTIYLSRNLAQSYYY